MPRLRSLAGAAVVLALVVASHGYALADAHSESPTVSESADMSGAQMTLPAGAILVAVPIEVNLTKDLVAKPLSIAPDIWYGVSEKLTVGLVHSSGSLAGFAIGGFGTGVCVTGEDNGCGKVYDNVGADARFSLVHGDGLLVAAEGGLFASSFDPFTLLAKVGVTGMLPAGPAYVLFAPHALIGITERDGGVEQVLNFPVGIAVGLGSKASFGVQTGIFNATLNGDFADTITLPLVAGVRFIATSKISVDASFAFPAFYSRIVDDTNFDVRSLVVSTSIAL